MSSIQPNNVVSIPPVKFRLYFMGVAQQDYITLGWAQQSISSSLRSTRRTLQWRQTNARTWRFGNCWKIKMVPNNLKELFGDD